MMISRRAVVIKSPQEIDMMRRAGRINALALDTVKNLIEPGITTATLDRAASEVIRKHGGKPAFKGYPGPYPFPQRSRLVSMKNWSMEYRGSGR